MKKLITILIFTTLSLLAFSQKARVVEVPCTLLMIDSIPQGKLVNAESHYVTLQGNVTVKYVVKDTLNLYTVQSDTTTIADLIKRIEALELNQNIKKRFYEETLYDIFEPQIPLDTTFYENIY